MTTRRTIQKGLRYMSTINNGQPRRQPLSRPLSSPLFSSPSSSSSSSSSLPFSTSPNHAAVLQSPHVSKPLTIIQFQDGEGVVEGTLPLNGLGVAEGQFAEVKRSFPLSTISTFTTLTGDSNPLHDDSSKIVPGILVSSAFPSLLSSLLPNAIYRSQTLKFAAPVYAGQEVLVRIDVSSVKTLRNVLVLTFETSVFRVMDGLCVLGGEGEAVLKGGVGMAEMVEE
eukprot:CAMPEP_0118650594 /NCGR_PEP_ID=MMETSP0785-20121206/10329_1 /TAXON_ID=91992 /ORGANISM="Bolidomonas pacifica, Strain CCMP 1866" /LENGTH=224 /DNA_ID=CAMNT_0006542977 /DNA_START=175 /DNA_END=846 /DNA_ORIENTATION=+